MNLISSSSLFSGLPVRDLLRQMTLKTENSDIQIAMSLFFGTTKKTKAARKKSHLTHATEMDHQIRFALKDRVDRSITKLASHCAKQLLKKSTLELAVELSETDYLSHIFFNQLQKEGVHICSIPAFTNSETLPELLNDNEKELITALRATKKDLDLILAYSRERVYTGDYSTAYSVLMELDISERNDSVHQILGLCCNFSGKTDESESHFRRLHLSANVLSKVKAAYLLSMLYLRLHPKYKQNLETAELFLSESHQLIESNVTMKDYHFHSVFNRNGYALCLFRRGKILEALEMLQVGVEKLKQSDDGAKNLHQSVLIYNAVQCLKALKRYEECEILCQNLLTIDSLFPEYWLELSIVYLEQSKFDLALAQLKKAENLDAFIPEIYALRGYAYLNQNQFELAIMSYKKATSLAPENLTYQSDLQYCLEMQSENILENII